VVVDKTKILSQFKTQQSVDDGGCSKLELAEESGDPGGVGFLFLVRRSNSAAASDRTAALSTTANSDTSVLN
jgi:hypothetical protein